MIPGLRMSQKDLVLSELEHFENTPGAPSSVLFSARSITFASPPHDTGRSSGRRAPDRVAAPGGGSPKSRPLEFMGSQGLLWIVRVSGAIAPRRFRTLRSRGMKSGSRSQDAVAARPVES